MGKVDAIALRFLPVITLSLRTRASQLLSMTKGLRSLLKVLFAITKNHWVMALDSLAFLCSSLTILSLVRSSDLMLESTLSSVTTFYQVPCGCQGYSFELTLHASIPGRQGPVPAGGLHVPGRKQSFCTY